MASHFSHALPFVVKGARFSLLVPYLNSEGTPTAPTTPDTEISKDTGEAADCAEEATTITGLTGLCCLTLTGDETNCTLLGLQAKAASGPKTTLLACSPRVLPSIRTGTAQAGAAGSITLDANASAIDDAYNGCIVKTTGGTGGGSGSGSLNNQARIVTDYNGTTKVATVEPDWETTPNATTTFSVLMTDLAAGAALRGIPWNSGWDAEVQSEVVDGLTEYGAITDGGGAVSHTLNVKVGGVPVDGAEVRITSDEEGNTAVAGPLYTDASGNVVFWLDVGTWYAWIQSAGYDFSNPTTVAVT